MSYIEDYAFIGDLRTAALVGRDGSIDWLCLPDFDSCASFAKLLGGDEAGCWRLAPADGDVCTERRYRGDTLILESTWETPTGTVRVIDTMPPRGQAADIVRVVEGVSGSVDMSMTLCIRFDYGHVVPWVRKISDGIRAVAGPDALWLRTPVQLTGRDLTTRAEFTVSAGERVPFVLTYKPSHEPGPQPVEPEQALRDTEEFWAGWVRTARRHDDTHVDASVIRSLITLKALTFAPTGGIVAAATTSLPEQVGGERNWDYRFCWLRDATFVLRSFLEAGYTEEARAWRQWLLRAVAGDPADLQIMYSLDGRRRLPEQTLDWLDGFRNSRPVRIGNAASDQLQLDVWGEVLDSLHLARESGIAGEDSAWDLQVALLDFLEKNWDKPDNGLWEIRGERKHFVHSKVMAWVGFDRAVQAVEKFHLPGPVEQWREIRDRIHEDVCRDGFDAERNTFTQFYGADGLDASLLLIPIVGFLPWDDPRVAGTVDAVQDRLLHHGFLLRYDTVADGGVDGLAGTEGTFTACTFWLAEALAGLGRHDAANDLFQRLLTLCNDVGLLSEEYDPATGHHLGNTPQAYSHVGLINAAARLARSSPRSASSPEGTS